MKDIDYQNTAYRRQYVGATVAWRAIGWQGRAVYDAVHRVLDRSGLLLLDGEDPDDAVQALTDMPLDVVKPGLRALIQRDWLRLVNTPEGMALLEPHFLEAEEATRSDRQRQRESRERRRTAALLPEVIDVTKRDGMSRHESQNVTECHDGSRRVTPTSTSTRSQSQEPEEKEFGGDPPDLAPEARPKKRRSKKDAELDWRVRRVHQRLCHRRKRVLEKLTGAAAGTPPALHRTLYAHIRQALRDFDADLLGPDDRDRWDRDSIVGAAAEGLWLSPLHNGSDEKSSGKRYVEPARAFTQYRRQGGHGCEQFPEIFFSWRDRMETKAGHPMPPLPPLEEPHDDLV